MKTPAISKKTIITIVVVLLLAIGYFYFSGGSAPVTDNSLLLNGVSGGIGTAELSLLNQMRSLHIDTSLFKDPAYTSLIDRSVDIAPQNVGRSNPFAPVSGVPNPYAPEEPSVQKKP